MTTWEERARPAVEAMASLRQAMVNDLDTEQGGFGWWAGYIDPRRVALLSEYLIASTAGVGEALNAAALQGDILREKHHADAMWAHQQWTRVSETKARPSDDDFLAALQRGPFERRRTAEISAAREHAFFHLAQALDRLAACIIGVSGLHLDMLRADWNHIRRALQKIANSGIRPLDDRGTEGRAAQEDLLGAVRDSVATGPTDWLDWLLRQRDTMAHRAPKIDWQMLTESRRPRIQMVSPFYRQPGWSEVESMANMEGTEGPEDLLIMRDPIGIVDGLVAQTAAVVTESAHAMLTLWTRRRGEPTLIIQPGSQWPTVMEQPMLGFDGFTTERLKVIGGKVHVAPENAKRLQASKVMDADRSFWAD